MTVTWNPSRSELVALLQEESVDLADLYRHSIDTLAGPQLTFASIVVVGQCIRELFNGLPRALGDPVSDRTDVERPAKELYEAWLAADMAFNESAAIDEAPRSMPAAVYRAAQAVASSAAAGRQTSRELTALFATGRTSNLEDAAMRRLHSAIEFFRQWVHLKDYSQPDRSLPSMEAVEIELRIIEEAILTRLGNMADRVRALREVLSAANRRLDVEPT